MAYEKVWANNEKLNKNEINKLKKDGLSIFDDIPKYAKEGFASIPKDQYMYFKYAGLTVQKPQDKGLFMLRVKVPTGIMNNNQAVVLSEIGNAFGRGFWTSPRVRQSNIIGFLLRSSRKFLIVCMQSV
ncbi:ferredoxin-sulfite reductase [Sporolactobacillus inulinus]|uniref:Ferredoxin-sulfite reductase n=1 Tax=Sporolactobacillus inulinus TaxID=2078 RepID=A0A4Y1ZD44_9BACL|nr:ferredoxin-sulfite reductase [Sporolactobacillus inulinus]